MPFVLDVSIAAKWFLPDEISTSADEILDRVADEGALVPALFRWQIQNVLLRAERAGRIDAEDVDEALDSLRDFPIAIESFGSRLFAGTEVRLARRYDLTAYDAAYLAIAASHNLPLATADSALARSSRSFD